MKFMEVLTRLVVGMGKFGDHLLKKKFSGVVVAALAFACGAGLAYACKPAPRAKPAAPPAAVTSAEFSSEEYEARLALAEWKNEHGGSPLPSDDPEPVWRRMLEAQVVILPSGRTLVGADDTLYMLDAGKRVVWKHEVSQWIIDFAHVPATGLVYVTAGDNNLFILDAATGRVLHNESRNGRAGFGVAMPYGDDVCLVADDFSGYRADYEGGYEPMQDGVTAWRGTRALWHVDVPPDAELQVVGSRIFAVTKTKSRILVKEIEVPKGKR